MPFNHFKVYQSVVFNMFMMLCGHHPYPVPEHFCRPKSNPYLPILSVLHPLVTTNLLSVPMDLLLDISYKWNQIIYGLLFMASFTLHVLKVHPCCSMFQYFIPFYD